MGAGGLARRAGGERGREFGQVDPALGLGAALAALLVFTDLDAWSTARQFAGQRVVFRGNSPYGRLVATESAGQFTFFENGLPLFSTHQTEQIEETVHYALAQRPQAGRVLLVSGGIAGTAREALRYPLGELAYVELDPLILQVGRRFLPGSLAEPRLRVIPTDGRRFIQRTRQRFDVVILDVPAPSTSQLNRFYTAEFFGEVKRALTPNGVLAFALGQYANYVSPELARLLASAHRTLRQRFAHVLIIPGGRVFFLASDGPLHTDIAARLETLGLTTRLVNRHYLQAMLAPDRLADMARAVAQPAAINRDFNPVLYSYHLRHWLSQFGFRPGLLLGAVALGLAVYLAQLRPVPLTVCASGFAATALEVVLLLAFQILCGSLYQQVGLIVTTFMAGLALGAWAMNRRLKRAAQPGRRALAGLALALALLAAVLPLALGGLARAGAAAGPLAQVGVPALTLGLAGLVGMQFPLATRLEFRGAAATASQLYTADFVGACLGALLPGLFLLPLWGVTATCTVTAAVNGLAAGLLWFWPKPE